MRKSTEKGELNIHMIITLLGASESGKSTIKNELATHHGFEKIILYLKEIKTFGQASFRN